jgi:pyruvate/2-oxoglutarate dehydrogenase complex dihydrolipoamide dehydrogenase (E3) component
MESERATIGPASATQRIVVIGGGVAGLEAARTAALAGHSVTLFERATQLGGQLALAARASGRGELIKIVHWLERAVGEAGVHLVRATEATTATISTAHPDIVIVATGARAVPSTTFETDRAVSAGWQFLESGATVPPSVAIVAEDQGWEPLSLAVHLASQGCNVELVTSQLSIGVDVPAISLPALITRLKRAGVRIHTSARVVQLAQSQLTLEDVHTLERSSVSGIDEIVLSGCRRAEDSLLTQLKLLPSGEWRLVAIGDCLAPRDIASAIWDGHRAGLEIGARPR